MACSCKTATGTFPYEVLNSQGVRVDEKRTQIEAAAAARRVGGSFRLKIAGT